MKYRIIDYDAVYGYVDYGDIDSDKNGGCITKKRCKTCGAAWLAENHLDGHSTCPKCGETKRGRIISPH